MPPKRILVLQERIGTTWSASCPGLVHFHIRLPPGGKAHETDPQGREPKFIRIAAHTSHGLLGILERIGESEAGTWYQKLPWGQQNLPWNTRILGNEILPPRRNQNPPLERQNLLCEHKKAPESSKEHQKPLFPVSTRILSCAPESCIGAQLSFLGAPGSSLGPPEAFVGAQILPS